MFNSTCTFSQRENTVPLRDIQVTHVASSVALFTKMAITSVQNQTVHLNADRLK